VPDSPGVYAVLRNDLAAPVFLSACSGGSWKARSPDVPRSTLEAAWVDDAWVLYLGKATRLRDRIGQYLDFGAGRAAPHYGGRYLWHLDRTDLLHIAWVTTDPADLAANSPRTAEKMLIQGFRQVYGARPFANLQD
jgi:hypothetical protein